MLWQLNKLSPIEIKYEINPCCSDVCIELLSEYTLPTNPTTSSIYMTMLTSRTICANIAIFFAGASRRTTICGFWFFFIKRTALKK